MSALVAAHLEAPEPTAGDVLAALHELASLVRLCGAHVEGSTLR